MESLDCDCFSSQITGQKTPGLPLGSSEVSMYATNILDRTELQRLIKRNETLKLFGLSWTGLVMLQDHYDNENVCLWVQANHFEQLPL